MKRLFTIFLGTTLLAFGLFNIHSQSHITEGGILGAVLLIEHWFDISAAISSPFLNVLCYALAWKKMGHNFIIYSLASIIIFSCAYSVFEKIGPLFPTIADHPLLASIAGGLCVGFGVGLSVSCQAAPGGDDALALLLCDVFHCKIQWTYLGLDLIVLLLSLSYIPLSRIIYSLITVTISGQIIGYIMDHSS